MKPNSQMTLGEFFRQCVGIDISKNKFTACLYMYDRASDVGCCTKSIDFDNTKSGFNQMVKWSRKEAQAGFPLTHLIFTPETEAVGKKRQPTAVKEVSWEMAEVAVDTNGEPLVGKLQIREAKEATPEP